MRILILFFTSILLTQAIAAQNILSFEHDGMLTKMPPQKILKNDTFRFYYPPKLPVEDQADLKKKILKKVQNTLDVLADSSKRSFYQLLWSEPVFDKIVAELKELKTYLKGRVPTNGFTFLYLPSVAELETDLIQSAPVFFKSGGYDTKKEQFAFKIIKTDPLRQWLINRFNKDISTSSLKTWENTAEYTSAWKNLTNLYNELSDHLKQIKKLQLEQKNICTDDHTLDGVFHFKENILDHDPLFSMFKNDSIYKKWIWMYEGSFMVNPLKFTSTDRFISDATQDTQRIKLFDEGIQRILDSASRHCEMTAEKLEALVKAFKTGKNRFTSSSTEYKNDVLDFTGIEDLQAGKKLINTVLLPAENDIKKTILHYDASNDFTTDKTLFCKGKLPAAIAEDEQLAIAVHNIPAKVNIAFAQNDEVLVDRSPAQLAIDGALSQVSDAITQLNPIAGTFQGILSNLGPAPPVPGSGIVINNEVSVLETGEKAAGKNQFSLTIQDTKIKSKGWYYTKEDIINYLKASIIDKHILKLLDYYFKYCDNSILDIRSATTLEKTTNRIIDGFNEFVKINEKKDYVLYQLRKDSLLLNALLKINRSLPPDSLTLKNANTASVYRSEIPDIDLNNAPKKIKYTLTEVKPKPGGAATDSVKNIVAKHEFKVGKKYVLQVSAGIGITLRNYEANEANVTDNEVKINSRGSLVKMTAGLHIYPWKLYMQDNSFMGLNNGRWKNRLSVFAGISIPQPLKNYYIGISDDLLPGVRLITGAHLFRKYKYKVNNNQIVEENSSVDVAGPFISINIDPVAFAKLIGLLK